MAKHPTPEEIVAKLRQADVLISQGQSVSDTIRALGVSSVTYYRWRREFGGLKSDQVRRMKIWRLRTSGCARQSPTSRSTS